jgi:PAS domain S-box-containing protein
MASTLLAGDRGGAPAHAAPAARKNVLILNSYEPTYRWTANIVRGAQAVFEARDDIELFIEYMDSKKAFTPEYAHLLSEIYARKYHNLRFDLIVSSDDDALDFLKTYRDQLFPGVPVVFSGVNAFRDGRIAGFSNVTGVNEEGDLDKSFAWIAQLRPATKELVFVFDQSATSAGFIHRLEDVETRWRQRFTFRVISNVTVAELQAQLRALHDDAVVFWGMFMRDRAGTPLSMGESHRVILAAAPVPLFGFTDVSVSQGAAGGFVVSGTSQGETAARMGLRILDGARAADVPIVRESPNVYMLSYPAFVRWRMDVDHPPPGAVVVDRPFSFYERYRLYVWAALGGMGGESLVILALIAAIRTLTRKSRARLRESEDRYRSIVEDGSQLICRFDGGGRIVFANGALARLVGATPAEVVGRSVWSLSQAPARDNVLNADAGRARVDALTPQAPIIELEQEIVTGAGERRWVLWTYHALFSPAGTRVEVQAVGQDITARREAELALKEALRRVEEGNVELGYANQNLQGVLDSMKEGLVVCDRQAHLTKVCSRTAAEWFGAPAPGADLADYLFGDDSPDKLWFRAALEQVTDEMLPFDVAVAQLPRTFERAEQTYSLTCRQVLRDGAFAELVFTLADVTQQLEQDRLQQLHRELPLIVRHLLRDREGFHAFVDETEQMLARLAVSTDGPEWCRLLHTLKGSAAVYGFELFATHCHELEDLFEAEGGDLASPRVATGVQALARDWGVMLAGFSVFLGGETQASIRLEATEHAEFLQRLESREDHAELLRLARGWSDPPIAHALSIYARTIRQLATRLNKEVEPRIVDHRVRLPGAEMRSFLGVLVHVVRNSVDHGIEPPAERSRAGKPRAGQVTIESRVEGAEFVIAVDDDGRGIDWEAIRTRALRRGLPASTERDLIAALFTDGISTRDVVSDLSGRGVGLSAVQQVCHQLGGTIHVDSRPGQGTRFEFRFVHAELVEAPRAAASVHAV